MCLNDTRKPFEPVVAMCRDKNGQLLTNKEQVLSKWEEYFEQYLNESSEEPPTENDVIIDLPSWDEFFGAIKYLEDIKEAGSAAELLKSGGSSLVIMHSTRCYSRFQSARHYLKAGARVYGVQCTRTAINLIASKNDRSTCLLNIAHKVFAKVLHSHRLP
jgi:hypothetical protein